MTSSEGEKPQTHDVVIVGAGFAGLTAARELRAAGLDCLVVEARGRIGGRTYTAERDGHLVELGGFDVHWLQAHTWAEVTRYGLELEEPPPPEWTSWHSGGERHVGTLDDLNALLSTSGELLSAEALTVFERPHDPFHDEAAVAERDTLSVADRLRQLDLTDAEFDVANAFWSTAFQAPCEEGALTQALRWLALSGWNMGLCLDICARYRVAGGIQQLYNAIARASGAQIDLNRPVQKVEQDDEGVTITTQDGRTVRALAAIVTVPINALSGIKFQPPLSAGKTAIAHEGQASRGFKLIVRAEGQSEPFLCLAPPDQPLTFVQFEANLDDDHLIVAFGPDVQNLDLDDPHAVESALRAHLPGVKVINVMSHDWTSDEYSRETWPMLRPRQLTAYLRELQQPEHRVVLAGSDYARGWAGFIDGAIESGITVSSRVAQMLRKE